MSYAEELSQLTDALDVLLASRRAGLDASTVQAALSGRAAILGLLASLVEEAAGSYADDIPVTLSQLALRPAATLSALLHRYPRPRGDLTPDGLSPAAQTSPVGRAWVHAGDHATLAQQHWLAGGRRLSEPTAWQVLADTAAIAKTLAVLDGALLDTVAAQDRGALVAPLTRQHATTLLIVAGDVLDVARSGPLPAHPPHRQADPVRGVLTVASTDDLLPALHRLADLLTRSGPIRPADVHRLIDVQARLYHHMADTLPAAASLRGQADRLAQAAAPLRRMATVWPADRRAVHQAGEIHRALTSRHHMPVGDLVDRWLPAADRVTVLLAAVARREAAAGRWLELATGSRQIALIWRPAESGATSAMIDALSEASRPAARRLKAHPAGPPPTPTVPPPSQRLTPTPPLARRPTLQSNRRNR